MLLLEDQDNDPETKTEEPTGKRLEDSYKKGNIPKSKEVTEWGVIFAAMIVLVLILPHTSKKISLTLIPFLSHPETFEISRHSLHILFKHLGATIGLFMFLPLSVFLFFGISIGLAQSWKGISFEAMKPNFSKLSFISGFKNLFSFKSVLELLKGIIKMCIVAATIFYIFAKEKEKIHAWLWIDAAAFSSILTHLIFKLFVVVLIILTFMAVFDYFYQKFKFIKDLRMTKQEVKDEAKDSEGDPHIKGKIRSKRLAIARQNINRALLKATVVITNPTHFSVALAWDENTMNAPTVVAKGKDHIALQMRELATQKGIPLVENPPLARALYNTVAIDQEVPPDQYQAIADVIRFVMKLKSQRF